jgi:hypothetical protein
MRWREVDYSVPERSEVGEELVAFHTPEEYRAIAAKTSVEARDELLEAAGENLSGGFHTLCAGDDWVVIYLGEGSFLITGSDVRYREDVPPYDPVRHPLLAEAERRALLAEGPAVVAARGRELLRKQGIDMAGFGEVPGVEEFEEMLNGLMGHIRSMRVVGMDFYLCIHEWEMVDEVIARWARQSEPDLSMAGRSPTELEIR